MCRALHRYTLHIRKGHLADIKVVLAINSLPTDWKTAIAVKQTHKWSVHYFPHQGTSLDKSDFTCDIFTVFLNTISSIEQSFAAHKES